MSSLGFLTAGYESFPYDLSFSFTNVVTGAFDSFGFYITAPGVAEPLSGFLDYSSFFSVSVHNGFTRVTYDIRNIFISSCYTVGYINELDVSPDSPLTPFFASAFGSSSPVDLSSVLTAISNLDSKIQNLDLQIPDDLGLKIQSLNTQVSNLDLSSLPSSLSPIDLTDLNGNYCKYPNGTLVYYGAYGIHEVVKSYLSLTADNQLTPFYVLRRNIALEGAEPLYVYNSVPQDYVFPVVLKKESDS
ncbi:MAG: hypothetical protein PHE67_05750 [Campylobacterales bacterium]|nr:hypothetical protein [Campylobacterales bacterium]